MMVTEEKRLIHQGFMTTETEDAVIHKKMKTFGIRKKSAFFRAMVLNGYLLKLDLPEIREVLRLMKNLTNNVNQLARRLNERGNIYETELFDIRQRMDALWSVMNQILTRLEGQQS